MKKFEAPELEVMTFAAEDILATSTCPNEMERYEDMGEWG